MGGRGSEDLAVQLQSDEVSHITTSIDGPVPLAIDVPALSLEAVETEISPSSDDSVTAYTASAEALVQILKELEDDAAASPRLPPHLPTISPPCKQSLPQVQDPIVESPPIVQVQPPTALPLTVLKDLSVFKSASSCLACLPVYIQGLLCSFAVHQYAYENAISSQS